MKKQELILRAGQKDTSGCVPLKWVSPETTDQGLPVTERIPVPVKTTYPLLTGFKAAGKYYSSLRQLTATEEAPQLCRDKHGREVVCVKELFPCFDSYDYLHEHRYYRWFFLRCEDRLTMVYFQDEGKTVEVTEDVSKVKDWQWEAICELWNLE